MKFIAIVLSLINLVACTPYIEVPLWDHIPALGHPEVLDGDDTTGSSTARHLDLLTNGPVTILEFTVEVSTNGYCSVGIVVNEHTADGLSPLCRTGDSGTFTDPMQVFDCLIPDPLVRDFSILYDPPCSQLNEVRAFRPGAP